MSLHTQLPPEGKSFVLQQYVAPEPFEQDGVCCDCEPWPQALKSPHQQLDAVP